MNSSSLDDSYESKSEIWEKSHVDVMNMLQQLKLDTKRFELERVAGSVESEIVAKEMEIEEEARNQDTIIFELRNEITSLEKELSSIKDSRKYNILQLRKQIEQEVFDYQKEDEEAQNYIDILENQIFDLRSIHERSIDEFNVQSMSDGYAIDEEITSAMNELNFLRQQYFDLEEKHNQKMDEAASIMEMMKAELVASQKHCNEISNEIDQLTNSYSRLQGSLLEHQEVSAALRDQLYLTEIDRQKFLDKLRKLNMAAPTAMSLSGIKSPAKM